MPAVIGIEHAVRARLYGLDPAVLEDGAAVLEREQRAALRGLRQLHHRRLADLVFLLVGSEREHVGRGAGLVARRAGPGRPVDVEHAAGAMPAVEIAGAHQVAAPFRDT